MGTREPAFGPFIEECARHGISRSVAYELLANGQLETFKLGAKRYILTESLRTLPSRMGSSSNSKAKAAR